MSSVRAVAKRGTTKPRPERARTGFKSPGPSVAGEGPYKLCGCQARIFATRNSARFDVQAARTTISVVARETEARNPQMARVNEGVGVSIMVLFNGREAKSC
jgi:hypothetical protein